MKLTSIIALNEGAYSKLAEWEAAAKKLGYTVTKDNKSGTYHAWDKTSHKGRFSAPTGKGSLTEGVLNKIADKVMGKAPTNKYKVGDEVSYEMDPPQEGGRGKGKITSVSKAGDHYTVNGKFVNHFEIKKKHTSVKESAGEPSVDDILYYLTSGYRTLQKYADSYQDFSTITRIYDGLRMDLKEGNYIAFSRSYEEYLSKYPDAAGELYDAMFEAAGLPADEGTIEEFLQKCSGVMEGINETYVIIRTDSEGKKDVFAGGFDTYEKAQKELDDCLAHPLHTKHKQKFEIKRKGQQGVKEGIGDTIKRGVKQVQRGMQGWGNQGMKNMTDKETPRDLVNRNKGHDDEKVKSLSKFRKAVDQERPAPAHSPQALQNRVLDREMKKRGLGEAAKREDMTGCKCTKCSKGTYQETSQMDDTDGVLHCTNCGTKVARYKSVKEAYTGHFNDDDWYEVDPKTNTVVRHAGGHAAYRASETLPNGNVLMRGMRAKDLQGVTESVSPYRKGDIVAITADSKYKGEKCRVLSVDRKWEILEVTMINFPGSHIRSDWRNFTKVV